MFLFIRAAALLLCASVWVASTPLRAQGAQELANTMPDGPGKALVTAQCVGCHTLELALSKRGTTDEWSATVKVMIDRGARITS